MKKTVSLLTWTHWFQKSSNNEVFSFIRKTFDQKIKAIDFIENNVETFKAKDGTVSKYQQLNTSIPKLR